MNRSLRFSAYVLLPLLVAATWFMLLGRTHRNAVSANQGSAVAYRIINDDMGDVVSIGIANNVNEQDLRATLVKAANDLQDNPARDYFGLYLWIKAYLLRDGRQSIVPAGTLRRFIPLANPAERKAMTS